MRKLVLSMLLVFVLLMAAYAADLVSFKLSDEIYACDSPRLQKELWVAAVMDMDEGTNNFDRLLYNHTRNGRVIKVPVNTTMTMTGRVTGVAVEVTVAGHKGTWSIPAKPVRAAGITLPPNNYEYLMEE